MKEFVRNHPPIIAKDAAGLWSISIQGDGGRMWEDYPQSLLDQFRKLGFAWDYREGGINWHQTVADKERKDQLLARLQGQ